MKIGLKSIALTNFRSFVDETFVKLPDKGLVLLRGDSGAGKSSLGLGLAYTLGYCPFPATVLQSWSATDPLCGSVELTSDKGTLRIKRGKKLSLELDGQAIRGGAAKLEEEIKSYIGGLSPELVEVLTYRRQKNPGVFLTKPDSEKKEFLCKILGLDKIEESVSSAQESIKKLTIDLQAKKQSLDFESRKLQESKGLIDNSPLVDESETVAFIEKLTGECVGLENQVQKLETDKSQLENELKIKQESLEITYLSVPRAELERELIETKNTKPPKVSDEALVNAQNLLDQAKQRLEKLVEADYIKKQERSTQITLLTGEIDTLKTKVSRIEHHQKDKARLQKELSLLNENVCPTCNQFWLQAADRIKKIQRDVAEIDSNVSMLENLKPEIQKKQSELDNISKQQIAQDPNIVKFLDIKQKLTLQVAEEQEKIRQSESVFKNVILAKVVKIQSMINELVEKVVLDKQKLIDTYSPQIAQVEKTLKELRGTLYQKRCIELPSLQKSLAEIKAQNQKKVQLQNEQMMAAAKYEVSVGLLQKEMDEVNKRVMEEEDFVKLLGREGFLGSIFDEILVEIANETNEILCRIPNVSRVTVRFVSDTLTLKGNVKRNITPVVTVDGHEAPLAAGLSGGMGTSVDLAVDLAIGRVLARRTGCELGWLVLDEAFDGLSAMDKEACMSVLQQISEERVVIVVDHDNQFKELFTQVIDFKLENGKSIVNQEIQR